MKAVLLSIHPRWCKEIFVTKRKTIEVRKNDPRLEPPFTVYVYQTKHKYEKSDSKLVCDALDELLGGGKVIGAFVCDEVEQFFVGSFRSDDIEQLACLSYSELINYFYKPEELDGKTVKWGFGWHITEPKLFDKPRALQSFLKGCDGMLNMYCGSMCDYCSHPCNLTRPPQSWCYVEALP